MKWLVMICNACLFITPIIWIFIYARMEKKMYDLSKKLIILNMDLIRLKSKVSIIEEINRRL